MEYIDFKLQPVEKFIAEFGHFKNKVFERFDWLMAKYQKFEDEHTILSSRQININDKLENHEIRISTLEKKHTS
ncbi:hypothetical protein HYW87_01015 [Candidatus Roizmanbacteria bacterium]|nr:hypothetical protein [Candidatus Roizmanbacteria bacterium]